MFLTSQHFSTLPEGKSKPGYEGTSEAPPKNWMTKLEAKFAESEKKMSSLEINCN